MAAVSHEEAEEIRVKICEYIKTHRDVISADLMKAYGLTFNQALHHLRELTKRGHLTKEVKGKAQKRNAIYNLGKQPYKKKVKPPKKEVVKNPPSSDLHPKAREVCRVFRLLDRKPEPQGKRELRKTHVGSMQSGMAMFGNWE
jgi:DNA-binding transcriptional MocR family regulator